MVTFEELKEIYPVTSTIYGPCLVIPTSEFGAAWEPELLNQGCKVFQGSSGSRAVLFIRPPKPEMAEEPREVYAPLQSENDQKLIDLWNSGASIQEILPHFPRETESSLKHWLHDLRGTGKLKPRKRGRRLGKPAVAKTESATKPSPSPGPLGRPSSPSFNIATTLTLNIKVDCSDKKAVTNFHQILKKLGDLIRGET